MTLDIGLNNLDIGFGPTNKIRTRRAKKHGNTNTEN